MSNKKKAKEQNLEVAQMVENVIGPEEVTEPVVQEAAVEKTIIGVVSNCQQLRVRNKPSKQGEVIKLINEGTTVKINEKNSTSKWYNVIVKPGVEGFCMKDFITIK